MPGSYIIAFFIRSYDQRRCLHFLLNIVKTIGLFPDSYHAHNNMKDILHLINIELNLKSLIQNA